jgi:CRP/FNR family transcriptional regulator, anaerobic regulatory protein
MSSRDEMAREQLKLSILKISDNPDLDPTDFLNIFSLKSIPKKTIIINQGESSDKVYFVIRGMVRIYYIKEEKEITNWFIEENNFFAATYSLFTGQPNVYIYESLEDLEVLCCSYGEMQQLYASNHDFEHIGRKMIELYYSMFLKKSYDVMFLSAEERYQTIMELHPEWLNRIPLKHIASYLGLTQETLSRLRAK